MIEIKSATSVFTAGQSLQQKMQQFEDYNDYIVNLMELSRILSEHWNVNFIVYNQHIVQNPIPSEHKLYKIQKTFALLTKKMAFQGNMEIVVIFFKKGFHQFDIQLPLNFISDIAQKDDYIFIKDVIWVNKNFGSIQQKIKQSKSEKVGLKKVYTITFKQLPKQQ